MQLVQLLFVLLCFGYFTAYVPYTIMTKLLSKGLLEGMKGPIVNWAMQPSMVLASFLSMYVFITLAGWWKYAQHKKILGVSVPWPHWFTFISGVCTAGQIITTTLSYTYKESIVFVMLLMRGGVLVLAPLVDIIVNDIRKRKKMNIPKREIHWYSVTGLVLSLGAVIAAFIGEANTVITTACIIDVCIYLFVYFWRFYFMDTYAKTEDKNQAKCFFVEEQATANPVLFLALLFFGILGIFTPGPKNVFAEIWQGFSIVPFSGYFWFLFLAGVFSYGTGLFGSLIYLDKRAMTFCAPANRIASIFAGTVATAWLCSHYHQRQVTTYEIYGIVLVSIAVLFLAFGKPLDKMFRSEKSCNEIDFHNRLNP